MRKSSTLIIGLLLLHYFLLAQKITIPGKEINETERTLWEIKSIKNLPQAGKYAEIRLDQKGITNLYAIRPQDFTLQFQDENNDILDIELVLQTLTATRVKINNAGYASDLNVPVCYKGKVKGIREKHDVLLTIAPGFLSMQAILPGKTIAIEKENKPNSEVFTLYNSRELTFPKQPFSCGLTESPVTNPTKTQTPENTGNKPAASSDKCIFVFIDCTDSLFLNRGSVQNTVNYVYSLWNDIRTAYNNEQINISISEINVWTTPAPFTTTTRELGIQTFAGFYQNNYWGNMAMLLDWSTNQRSAVAGGYGWAKSVAPNTCGNYNPNPNPAWNHGSFIYSDLNYAGIYANFPVMSVAEQVYLCVHEIGHLLNSEHTHSCSWPGGPIDNCNPVEGSCPMGPAPVNGGTFMSYCIDAGEFMNFTNGFGPLPGNKIRAFVDGNGCLNNCENCLTNRIVGAISNPGVYHYEVTNQLTAIGVISGNSTFIKLDVGNRVVLQPGFKATIGTQLRIVIDGCGGVR
jgi:hypothetical protein